MRRVVVESPYAGDVDANVEYLVQCLADSLSRQEAPFASHRMYPGVLDDADRDQRELGIAAGYEWMMMADMVVFYVDRGFSPGMLRALDRVRTLGLPHSFRSLESAAVLETEMARAGVGR